MKNPREKSPWRQLLVLRQVPTHSAAPGTDEGSVDLARLPNHGLAVSPVQSRLLPAYAAYNIFVVLFDIVPVGRTHHVLWEATHRWVGTTGHVRLRAFRWARSWRIRLSDAYNRLSS